MQTSRRLCAKVETSTKSFLFTHLCRIEGKRTASNSEKSFELWKPGFEQAARRVAYTVIAWLSDLPVIWSKNVEFIGC